MSEQSGPPEQPPSAPPQPASPYGVPPEGQGRSPYGPPPYAQQPTYGPPTHPAYGQASYGQPGFPMPGYGPAPRDPDARPGTVLAAGIITLVMTGIILLLLAVFTLVLVAASSSFLDGFRDSAGLAVEDPTTLFGVVLVGLLVFLAWCVAAIVLAILVLRRRSWARIALVVSSGLTILVSLLAIGGGVSVLPLGCAVAVIVLLFTGGAGDWFRHEHAYSPPKPLA